MNPGACASKPTPDQFKFCNRNYVMGEIRYDGMLFQSRPLQSNIKQAYRVKPVCWAINHSVT
jgi:hypothetical protein